MQGGESPPPPKKTRLNDLCATYRTTDNAAEKRRLMGEMYELAAPILKPSATVWKHRVHHAHDVHAERFDDAIYDTVKRIADRPETDPARFEGLLRGSIGNAMADVARQVKRKSRGLNFSQIPGENGGPDYPDNHHDPEHETPEELHHIEQAVLDALGKVPEKHLAAMAGVLDGKKYVEIAQSEGIPLGTVKSRIKVVRDALEHIPEFKAFHDEVEAMPSDQKVELADHLRSGVRRLLAERRAAAPPDLKA